MVNQIEFLILYLLLGNFYKGKHIGNYEKKGHQDTFG